MQPETHAARGLQSLLQVQRGDLVLTAIATMLARGAETGSLRGDIEPEDITVMLLGILLTTAGDSSEQTKRLLDLMLDALRTTT
ncbi:hypothetical protein [Nocardia sp. CA-119907]|uniref:SbtR family transcriptional regulator n=1 Tax=Nocardia sp. CA-119907 TaxID=3239973 RepID=UPI003D95385C